MNKNHLSVGGAVLAAVAVCGCLPVFGAVTSENRVVYLEEFDRYGEYVPSFRPGTRCKEWATGALMGLDFKPEADGLAREGYFPIETSPKGLWTTTYDWPCLMSVNFDGWHLLKFPITFDSPVKVPSIGCDAWQVTRDGSGNGRIDFPIKVTGMGFSNRPWGLDFLEMRPTRPYVRIKDVVLMRSKEALQPILPGGGKHFWNRKSVWYMYPPAFDFTNVVKAVSYRFEVRDDRGGVRSFSADKPTASLESVWEEVPAGGLVTVSCQGVGADGKPCGAAGESRTFWKNPPFDPAKCAPGVRPYGEAALGQYDFVFGLPHVRKMVETGKLDYTYPHNCYPTKMNACLVGAALRYAALKPSERKRMVRIARAAADCLIDLAEPADAPLAGFTPTYAKGSAFHAAKTYAGQNMLCYPALSGSAFLALFRETKDEKYRAAAARIADTYLRLQGEDGTWYLKLWEKDGQPVAPNRLLPFEVCDFLLEMAEVSGESRYRAAADRAFDYVERGPLENWNWEGQFEDVAPTVRYENLTHHPPCAAAIFLLKRYPGDKRRLAQARELLRFAEDQFVAWERPCRADGTTADNRQLRRMAAKWPILPVAVEQYHWYVPVNASLAKMIRTYLALYAAERNPLDLAKAKALGDALTRAQCESGCIPSEWMGPIDPKSSQTSWINCQLATADALVDLAKY